MGGVIFQLIKRTDYRVIEQHFERQTVHDYYGLHYGIKEGENNPKFKPFALFTPSIDELVERLVKNNFSFFQEDRITTIESPATKMMTSSFDVYAPVSESEIIHFLEKYAREKAKASSPLVNHKRTSDDIILLEKGI